MSLLAIIYKVIVEVMTNKMKQFIQDYILSSQTRFVKDICILNNMFIVYEAMEYVEDSNQD